MARIRTIKPEFFAHEGLFDAEKETGLPLRVAFIGLLCQCDREGRFRWRVRALKSHVLPFDDVDFSRVLDALGTRGFVVRYACDGEEFGAIPTFLKHQAVNNRESKSEIPPPPEAAPDKALTRAPRVPHASGACISGKEGKGWEQGKEKNKSTARVPRAVSAPRFDARAHLRSLGVDDAIAADWLTLRTRKRAPPTATAIAGIAREAAKAGLSLADALRLCCERGWQALRADWLDGANGNAQAPRSATRSRGVPLEALDGRALDAMARELGIATSRPGESAQAFIGRIQAARNRLH